MADFFELDFLGVETSSSGDAITIRYSQDGITRIHVVDGGYIDTGDQIIEHIEKFYGNAARVDNVVLTHADQDHANGLRKVLEHFDVGTLWMNRPWLHAEELIHRFKTYKSVDALRAALREAYSAVVALEEIADAKGIPIRQPFQGEMIGLFRVLTPTRQRYLDLLVQSPKTPEATADKTLTNALGELWKAFKAATKYVTSGWGEEIFPMSGTGAENETSVVQYAILNGKSILLTGDTGRDGLAEAADYAQSIGLALPGVNCFQVPHHGGRHNVNTEVLDRWLGPRLASQPSSTTFVAICSSAKADADHPRKSVVRAMLHRGAHFSDTEGRMVSYLSGIKRDNWNSLPQVAYPEQQEEE